MGASNSLVTPPSVIADLPAGLGYLASASEGLLLVQRLQWEALLTWQRALAAAQSDLWDQWTCHYAGGVPLDG